MTSKRKEATASNVTDQLFLYTKLNENETKNLKKA